ncbi:hypothetical protein DBT_0106 [Dissulfuribacter thermophilus]|uniref:Uncharacterized protein n=1 Tax=Dissulfuribacter thermophilus TaxID=1156395 RepID=A0A1B9F8M3_9BACT|nr:hypothetical protein DBT_0106 [Dissulfuribacter thermophilus]
MGIRNSYIINDLSGRQKKIIKGNKPRADETNFNGISQRYFEYELPRPCLGISSIPVRQKAFAEHSELL